MWQPSSLSEKNAGTRLVRVSARTQCGRSRLLHLHRSLSPAVLQFPRRPLPAYTYRKGDRSRMKFSKLKLPASAILLLAASPLILLAESINPPTTPQTAPMTAQEKKNLGTALT